MRKTLLSLLLLLSACLPPAETGSTPAPDPDRAWGTALRALDPADASDPALDITAAYLHRDGASLLVRVDLLDFQAPEQVRLEILVADAADPGTPLYSIRSDAPDALHPMAFGPMLDTVTVEIDNALLPADPVLDVITPQDELRGLRPDGPVPPQAAPVLLAFYDTFAARFPAEALRSWDGAHSGPRGERHGLKHLLDAVETYDAPVVLLDLKRPESLSALDAMGALPRVRSLTTDQLLLLPEVDTVTISNLNPLTGEVIDAFDLPAKPFNFDMGIPDFVNKRTGFEFQFLTEDSSHLYDIPDHNLVWIPVPTESPTTQPTPDGPPLEVRTSLLETALNGDPEDLYVLGGSLRDSTWGNVNMVAKTLAYFSSRPYIRILAASDLARFPTIVAQRDPPFPETDMRYDDQLIEIEHIYFKQSIRNLQLANAWAESSDQFETRCGELFETTPPKECRMISENMLAIIDTAGARLTYLFMRDRHGGHQLIGPSWQVAVGLSDPALWHPELGEAADPGAYPGAFAESDEPFMPYMATIAGDTIVFVSEDGARTKTFRLTQGGLEVEYRVQEAVTTRIPLLVDPWGRTSPGWAEEYFLEQSAQELHWGLKGGPVVDLQAAGPLDAYAFNERLDLLGEPEDPDYEYPQGFYLPFPMAMVEAQVEGECRFVISVE